MDVTRPPKVVPTLVQVHKTTSAAGVVPAHTTATTTAGATTAGATAAEITKPIATSVLATTATTAPLPTTTAAALAKKPALAGVAVHDTLSIRAGGAKFPDGQKWVAQRLKEIAALTKLGMPVSVVFDLDNTVFDTRHRTLHALHTFDRQEVAAGRVARFSDVKIDDVLLDAAATATKLQAQLGLSQDVIDAAQAVWKTSFWTPANLVHDQPIADMVELIHRAQAAGATVKFLTGRTAPFHQASLDQLRKAGVVLDDDDVVCKPDVTVQTAPFKEQTMIGWAQKAELGFFVTEGVRDLEHMQSFFKELPLLRLDCSLEDGARLPQIPRWPAAF